MVPGVEIIIFYLKIFKYIETKIINNNTNLS